MSKLQPVRGTHDLMPEEFRRHAAVGETARAIAGRHGYAPIATPILEFTEVFARTLGETTDVVAKEMYTFVDRSGESLTLRPENTAGVARAFLSNKLTQDLPQRFFYWGPMFRHERPQKGRQRQFHQIGVEALGLAHPLADVEVILCAAEILRALGVLERCVLKLNSLGDAESRAAHRAALVAHLEARRSELSEDSLARLARNPLRVLDSKDPGDRAVVADAPRLADHYTPAAAAFFDQVRDGLAALGIGFEHDPTLVRGLDYYGHTAFEFVTDALGAQGTVLGGGRYDGLVAEMGGPPTPGVGWAAGVERLALLIAAPPPGPRPILVIAQGPAAERIALPLARDLRRAGHVVEAPPGTTLKKGLARADKINARWAILIGEAEAATGDVQLKDLDAKTQRPCRPDEVAGLVG